MGFDNDCILNMQALSGEYFCRVCQWLVYPTEAMQAPCTHLFCKQCLKYLEGTTMACPFDGYLVKKANSKPLLRSNKELAKTIGNIAVRCLYYRSGCSWQGSLFECMEHRCRCAFGNSPVECHKCGAHLLHRQFRKHERICLGTQLHGAQGTMATATATATAAVDTFYQQQQYEQIQHSYQQQYSGYNTYQQPPQILQPWAQPHLQNPPQPQPQFQFQTPPLQPQHSFYHQTQFQPQPQPGLVPPQQFQLQAQTQHQTQHPSAQAMHQNVENVPLPLYPAQNHGRFPQAPPQMRPPLPPLPPPLVPNSQHFTFLSKYFNNHPSFTTRADNFPTRSATCYATSSGDFHEWYNGASSKYKIRCGENREAPSLSLPVATRV